MAKTGNLEVIFNWMGELAILLIKADYLEEIMSGNSSQTRLEEYIDILKEKQPTTIMEMIPFLEELGTISWKAQETFLDYYYSTIRNYFQNQEFPSAEEVKEAIGI